MAGGVDHERSARPRAAVANNTAVVAMRPFNPDFRCNRKIW